jgi:uncharacterized protein DUF4190
MSEQSTPANDGPPYPPPPEYLSTPSIPYAPYPPPPAYPYPSVYGAPYAAPMPYPRANGFAITSLVCGILGLCAGGLLAAIPAIVFGHIALAQINRLGGMEQGRGLAIAGLVMGYVYLALITLYLVFIFGLFALPSFQP